MHVAATQSFGSEPSCSECNTKEKAQQPLGRGMHPRCGVVAAEVCANGSTRRPPAAWMESCTRAQVALSMPEREQVRLLSAQPIVAPFPDIS